jgi:hypothetical protein
MHGIVLFYSDIVMYRFMPMRRQGVRFSSMIDDRIGLAPSRAACWLDIFIVVRIICALGFHLGLAKSVLWTQQCLLYLAAQIGLFAVLGASAEAAQV